MKKHDERKVVSLLNRIPGIMVTGNEVKISQNARPGIHALGKIDFLTRHRGYVLTRM